MNSLWPVLLGVALSCTCASCGPAALNSGAPSSRNLKVRREPVVIHSNHHIASLPSHLAERVELCFEKLATITISHWSQLTHQLRFWGRHGKVVREKDTKESRSAIALIDFVLNADEAARSFGPIHVFRRHGVIFATGDPRRGTEGDSHRDHTAATLGQLGIRSDGIVLVSGKKFTVADIIRASASDATLDQEVLFTSVALGLYLDPSTVEWTNKYNAPISVDMLGERLSRISLGDGACNGTHALFAIAILLQVDNQSPVLSPPVRDRLYGILRKANALLNKNQLSNGAWNGLWQSSKGVLSETPDSIIRPVEEVVVTGHMLEWLAIAPAEIKVDEERVRRACEFLVEQILMAPEARLELHQSPFSHAGAALKVWYPDTWNEFIRREGPVVLRSRT